MLYRTCLLVAFALLCLASACEPDPVDEPVCTSCPTEDPDPLIIGPAFATPHTLEIPDYLPRPVLDDDNPLTDEGIELGRRLFYDPIMGRDSAFACASCHKQELAFTDGRALAAGIDGLEGPRNAMSLVNLVFNSNGFHWDGGFGSLWEQAIHPVENMLEMDEDWENVLGRIRKHDDYPRRFRAAFGVDRPSEISREMAVKAIAQFESTIISGNSRFDRVVYQNAEFFTEEEQLGADSLFFIENIPAGVLHPGCGHCHNAPLFWGQSV